MRIIQTVKILLKINLMLKSLKIIIVGAIKVSFKKIFYNK